MPAPLRLAQVACWAIVRCCVGLAENLESAIESAISHRAMGLIRKGLIVEFDIRIRSPFKRLRKPQCTNRDVGLLVSTCADEYETCSGRLSERSRKLRHEAFIKAIARTQGDVSLEHFRAPDKRVQREHPGIRVPGQNPIFANWVFRRHFGN